MTGYLPRVSVASMMTVLCSSVRWTNPFSTSMFSSIWGTLLMPDRTVTTPSRSAANLSAQEAGVDPGSAFWNRSRTSSGGVASIPPFIGSMTMTGFPCFLATS